MDYGSIDGIDKPVSRLIQGTMMLSVGKIDENFSLLDGVSEQGCTAFDLAPVYGGGDSERVLGRWMQARGNRERVVVVTKCAHPNADRNRMTSYDILSDLYDSLARLRTDYIDLYLLHRDDPSCPVGPVIELMDLLRREGRVRAFGGSNWTHERIAEANAYAHEHGLTGFAASSPQFSLVETVEPVWPGCLSITGAANAAARAWYAAERMPVLCWSSLGRGFLSNPYSREEIEQWPDDKMETWVRAWRSPENLDRCDRAQALADRKGCSRAQIGLAYVLQQPMNVFPLIGCETPEQYADNAGALDLKLTESEMAWLDLREAGV